MESTPPSVIHAVLHFRFMRVASNPLILSVALLFTSATASAHRGALPICVAGFPSNAACASIPEPVNPQYPHYSEQALSRSQGGEIALAVAIGKTGIPTHIRVVKSLGKELDQPAIAALKKTTFRPAKYKGQAVAVKIVLALHLACTNCRLSFAPPRIADYSVSRQVRSSLHIKGHLRNCGRNANLTSKQFCAPVLVRVIATAAKDSREAQTQGSIRLAADLAEDGETQNVRVLASDVPTLDAQAVASVKQWRFVPALYKNRPVPVHVVLELRFWSCTPSMFWELPFHLQSNSPSALPRISPTCTNWVPECVSPVTRADDMRPNPVASAATKHDWGRTQRGIRVGLSVERDRYNLYEDIPLHIFVENVSARAPIYGGPFALSPGFGGHSQDGSIEVQDLDGPLPRGSVPLRYLPMSGGPLTCPAAFVRRQVVPETRTLSQAGLLPDKPGRYKITVTWAPYMSRDRRCKPYNPVDPGFQLYASADSNAVFVTIIAPPAKSNAIRYDVYTAWKRRIKFADTSFGQNTALLDKSTHLEWLRLNFTSGLAYQQVVQALRPGGEFDGWRLATPEEVRLFFAHFTAAPDGRSDNVAVERKFQRLLGGPLSMDANGVWYREDTAAYDGLPVGPDNNMIHYHSAYIGEDSGPVANVDPDRGMSAVSGFASSRIATLLVRQYPGTKAGFWRFLATLR
jgi:TonB family protein